MILPPIGSIIKLSEMLCFGRQIDWANRHGLEPYWSIETVRWDPEFNWQGYYERFKVVATEANVKIPNYGSSNLVGVRRITKPVGYFIFENSDIVIVSLPKLNVRCPYCHAPAYMTKEELYCSKECPQSVAEYQSIFRKQRSKN